MDFGLNFPKRKLLSLDNIAFLLGIITFILNTASLILLIFKSRKSILFLNLNFISILSFLIFAFFVCYYLEKFDKNVINGLSITLTFVGLIIFMINKFKFQQEKQNEIDRIGKPE